MTNMKKSILLATVAALLVSVCLVSSARGARSVQAAPADTLVINTTELCKDVIGYDGPTPLVIKVVNGVVAKVEALPNTESPSYFERVIQGGLLKAAVGKKVSDAAKMKSRTFAPALPKPPGSNFIFSRKVLSLWRLTGSAVSLHK